MSSIPVLGHYISLYLFMYQETEMDSHPGKRGEREVNCDGVDMEVCVCANVVA